VLTVYLIASEFLEKKEAAEFEGIICLGSFSVVEKFKPIDFPVNLSTK